METIRPVSYTHLDVYKRQGCALVGGETSEMPGMYPPGHYDTNGTAVGAVCRQDILPKISEMAAGDVLLGLASSGVHSNGFSLVRKIIQHVALPWDAPCPWDESKTLGEGILEPTKIYVKQLLPSIRQRLLLGLAHITGGGLVENIQMCIRDRSSSDAKQTLDVLCCSLLLHLHYPVSFLYNLLD